MEVHPLETIHLTVGVHGFKFDEDRPVVLTPPEDWEGRQRVMDELQADLRELGFHSRNTMFGGPLAWGLGVFVAPGVWVAINSAIRGLAERNKGKEFQIELLSGETVVVNGHSAREVEKLLCAARDLMERTDWTGEELEEVAREAESGE
ncbi:hypothetical protein [Streptomyces sp. NBC_01198]|uniref:hypothetical protein n=1 Tax=Streptomyces sp. NBC_01198 TaxID=2903769 RepID=UPI002E1434DF|nr:hypothetical protein OG702_32050 [Streptomyces sp. NBC_01198]